ncbi:hypothetical protein B0A78_03325 [Flavobacterium columnare NBRC 100251 = ATCC 23463]|uniref:Uncharacterized protein n=1 Tax=Flavobacterium columnare TaxID=996 RepID=A0AAI8CHS2_9FLAO|nr:hypothetical protein [Flavobacterium columnare]AMO20961.1 hypothetical protein UN65_12025 [Flavobacterium columnare]ANO47503.1 outer membrane efflux protein [Flavobacterium columnare]APT21861.1 hypothetical protein BU993_03935 [Flavobacterium columnare]AUX18960.1 hypothetical protein AQ623_12260 [Flavobacterium columnare]MEB3801984.1 hypothetical protein [Flavobacterium columnare]
MLSLITGITEIIKLEANEEDMFDMYAATLSSRQDVENNPEYFELKKGLKAKKYRSNGNEH